MKIETLVKRLAGPGHRAASDALVALGAQAVRPVLDVLCDEDSPVDWATSATVLRRIGRPALDPLIEAMARSRGTLDGVYQAAAAEQARTDRRRTTALLTRHRVSVVDAPPATLAPALADAYLALKATGRL